MGNMVSQAKQPEPPKLVLVPPMFERDLKGRSRMAKSSYDYLFAKRQLKWLFSDYFASGLHATMYFSPQADPRISVKAAVSNTGSGALNIRYQPLGLLEPQTFLAVKVKPEDGGAVRLQACAFNPTTGIGVFGVAPAGQSGNECATIGLRYSSSAISAGASWDPSSEKMNTVWLVGRAGGITAGLQLQPQRSVTEAVAALKGLVAEPEGAQLAAVAAEWQRARGSVALSYSPERFLRSGSSSFTAALELHEGREVVASFLQHAALTRDVRNPVEQDNVVGITNYINVGMRIAAPLGPSDGLGPGPRAGPRATPGAAPGAGSEPQPGTELVEGGGKDAQAEATGRPAAANAAHGAGGNGEVGSAGLFQLAGSWQVNKNVLLKAVVGEAGGAAAAAFRVWASQSVWVSLSSRWTWDRSSAPVLGLALGTENFGALRYEQPGKAALRGGSVTRFQQAQEEDVASAEGRRTLVMRTRADADGAVPGPASSSIL